MKVFSPPSTHSEDTFLSGDCQLNFSTGSLGVVFLVNRDDDFPSGKSFSKILERFRNRR
jgi:hypothetical protein